MNNKKCKFEYELLDSYIAGIQLNGPEVKAIRDNKISFNDSFCSIENNEIYLNKFHISIKDGGENDFLRKRKLLLNKKEIIKIGKDIKEKGLTVVPSSIFFTKNGLVKLEINLARGKNTVNKKKSIKERDLKREFKKEI